MTKEAIHIGKEVWPNFKYGYVRTRSNLTDYQKFHRINLLKDLSSSAPIASLENRLKKFKTLKLECFCRGCCV